MPAGIVHNYVFRGDGNRFTNMSGEWMPSIPLNRMAAAYADLDNDGDLDLVINNFDNPPVIYRNKNSKGHNYLKLKFTLPRRKQVWYRNQSFALSLRINCKSRQLHCTRGFQSSVEPVLHFGLGTPDIVDSLIIIWPDNSYQKLEQVGANQTLNISSFRKPATFNWTRLKPVREKWFVTPDICKNHCSSS